jgi:multiple sugar transport system permease protein
VELANDLLVVLKERIVAIRTYELSGRGGPVMATVAIITFMSSWNNFLWPLIAVSNDLTRTLPIGIAQFMGGSSGASGSAPTYGMPTAAAAMATAPAVVVFLAMQRWFVRGITTSGIKG